MDSAADIIPIFEYYSNSISYDKKSFTSSKIWDDIYITLSRVCRINSIVNISNSLPNKRKPEILNNSFLNLDESQIIQFVNINENIINKKVLDVLKIQFNSFYPDIILRLCEERILEIDKNIEMFYFLRSDKIKYNHIKSMLSDDGKICLKIFVNFFYGKMNISQKKLVSYRGQEINQYFSKHKDWLYSETDEIFIKNSIGLEGSLKSDLDTLYISYDLENMDELLVLGRKKIVTIGHNKVGKINGFPIFKNFKI